jgi:diadenosine tetraphosphate (Ap4A) HIT family hydrolase
MNEKSKQKFTNLDPTSIPMPAIKKIKDIPLSSEQIIFAENNLDSKRNQDIKEFKEYQMLMYTQIQPPRSEYTQNPQFQNPQFQNRQMFKEYNPEPASFQQESVFFWNNPPLPEFLDPRKSIDLKLIRKTKKKDSRCYTCKPRGKVKKHMINSSGSGKFVFHHDMHKRPIIIMTPTRHIENIYEMTSDELSDLFKSLKEFTSLWNVDDYQLSFNAGNWQNHEHFHCKIRMSEKTISRMRRDHFTNIKLTDRYDTTE